MYSLMASRATSYIDRASRSAHARNASVSAGSSRKVIATGLCVSALIPPSDPRRKGDRHTE